MAEKTMDNYIMVFNTCDSAEMASSIAKMLVNRKLAACVNIVSGVESVYEWQGKIEHDEETLLIIKTQKSLFADVESAIQEIHNYELPEIIAVSIEAGEKHYLNWIQSATLNHGTK